MFEDTLLIIKPDYLSKRKTLLLFLLQQGFLIKGQRKICFTPELAAEFYHDLAENVDFMFQVILLSKGNSEAFILAKECGVENLLNDMVCYFGTSNEMEQNIHVTKCRAKVQREISYIFPNYIYEPIPCPEQIQFCANNPLVKSTIDTLYDIVTIRKRDPHKSWKVMLAESLILSNKLLPHISNQCGNNSNINAQDVAQQTKLTYFNKVDGKSFSSNINLNKDCSSINVTTSSCVSCSGFDSGAECIQQTFELPYSKIIKARTLPLTTKEPSSSSTFKTIQEGDLEKDINMEEHAKEVDTDEEIENKYVLDKDDLVDNASTGTISLQYKSNENVLKSKFDILKAEVETNVVPIEDQLDFKEPISLKEIPDQESGPFTTKENNFSNEDISNINERNNTPPEAQENYRPIEDIPLDKDVLEAGVVISAPTEEDDISVADNTPP